MTTLSTTPWDAATTSAGRAESGGLSFLSLDRPHPSHPLTVSCFDFRAMVEGCVTMTPMQTALECGILPAVSLLGMVGNCFCVVVFLRQLYRSVAQPLLLAFSAADTLFLFCTLLVSLPCIVRKLDERSGHAFHVAMMPQVAVLRDVMSRVSVVMTLAIGVDRCVAVTRPYKLRSVCTVPRARLAVLVVFTSVMALKAPAFFRYDVSHHVMPDNSSRLQLLETSFYQHNNRVLDFYFDYLLLVMLRLLPFVAMCSCFGIVLVTFKRRLRCACPKIPQVGAFAGARGAGLPRRTAETEHADLVLEERKLTRALLAVIFLRIVSELPGLVTVLFRILRPEARSSLITARDFSGLVSVLNSSINFLVFMGFYKHFSVTFKNLAGLCN